MSVAVQATADEGLGAPVDGADEGVAVATGEADGLGLGVLLQAPTKSVPTTARIAMGDGRGRPGCAMVALIKRLQRCGVPVDPTPSRRMRSKGLMGIEIERKFLVRDPSVLQRSTGVAYRQGYLSRDPDRTVRVRLAGDRAFVTIKGRSDGASRAEFEYPIPVADAESLLALCEGSLIDKTRYRIEAGALTWEVDVFHGANDGLVVAEVELDAPDQLVDIPDWIGDEVTTDPRYFNASLAAHPYRSWV
jgi:CYTH domain-containing protein